MKALQVSFWSTLLIIIPSNLPLDIKAYGLSEILLFSSIVLLIVALGCFIGAFKLKKPGLIWIGVFCLFLPIFLLAPMRNMQKRTILDLTSPFYMKLLVNVGPSIIGGIFIKVLFHR